MCRITRFMESISVYGMYVVLRNCLFTLGIPFLLLGFTPFFCIPLMYVLYVLFNWNLQYSGNGRIDFFRNLSFWKYIVSYFPIKLHRISKQPFDANKNYIFMSEPHGILCIGIGIAMNTEALNWSKLFPNINPHVASHDRLFWLPFFREYLITLGHVGCGEKSFETLFKPPNKGKAIGLIVGGGREFSMTYPNTYRFVLKNRTGYAKMALKYGACLVPTISFGENDYFWTFYSSPNTIYRFFQDFCRAHFGNYVATFIGRDLSLPIGSMPLRRPINVVVGEPINVPKVRSPTNEQIIELHELYKCKLRELFESEKYKYVPNADTVKLVFVT